MTARRRAVCGAGLLAAAVALSATSAVPAGASSPRHLYTPAGNAAAKAVVLRLSDFPAGWKADRAATGGGAVTCKSFDPDQSDLVSIGHADEAFSSPNGLGNVGSLVGIFKSAAQAQSSWNRIVQPGMLACLSSIFAKGASDAKSHTTVLSTGKLALAIPGRRHASYRIVADVATNGQHVKVYVDLIMQGRGPADTVMLVTSALDPPSPVFETKLAAAVASRLPR